MIKFIKYEIKGTYRFMLGILVMVIIATTLLQLQVGSDVIYNPHTPQMQSNAGPLIVMLAFLAILGGAVATFFYLINSFRNELYDDRGYLTFTLPLTGREILASKLLVALFWQLAIATVVILYNIALAKGILGTHFQDFFATLGSNEPVSIVSVYPNVLSILLTMILVYFAITLSRVTIKNKRIGGIWFVLFIVFSMLSNYLIINISTALPLYFNLSQFTFTSISEILTSIPPGFDSMVMETIGAGNTMFLGSNGVLYTNVVGLITQIALIILTFFGTGYLLENKINL